MPRMTQPRPILPLDRIHPAVQSKLGGKDKDFVEQIETAARNHAVLVVGLGWSPPSGKACSALRAAGVAFEYIQHGNYLTGWRRRNVLKMWTGWPTFPMVFVRGTFIGGASDLNKLIESGELKSMLNTQPS